MKYYLAVDIGASSGRLILGHRDAGKMILEEVHRFGNGMEMRNGHLTWDVDQLFAEIITGMKKCAELGKIPESIGVDTWAVDFVFLDAQDQRLGDAVGYRDHRTQGMDQKATEYTNASTTQLLNPQTKDWDWDLIDRLGYKRELFQKICLSGTKIGSLKPEIAAEVGFDCKVVVPATHDTGAAVMAVPAADDQVLYISFGTWSLMGTEVKTWGKLLIKTGQSFYKEKG